MDETLAKIEEATRQETASSLNTPSTEDSKDTVKSSNTSKEKEEAIEKAFYIAVGYNRNYLHYSEWPDGKLDEDYGHQNGFYLNVGYKSPNYYEALLAKPFIEGYFRYYHDLLHYKGAASNGITTEPFNCKQKSAVRNFGMKLGGYKDFSEKGEIFFYLDAGKRIWDRGENGIVDGVLVYSEKYYWIYLGPGLGINYLLLPKFSVGIDAEAMFAINPRMRADLYEGGTFKLKNVHGAEVRIPIKYYLLKTLSLDLTPYFTYWHIGQSNIVEISGDSYVEPKSKTHIEGLLAGLTYIF